MKKHLPSLQESLELVALGLMVAGLQYLIGSWGWTALFALGFIWNWSVLNGWALRRSATRKYRFSVLKGVVKFHETLTKPFAKYPKTQKLIEIFPAGLFLGFISYILGSPIPWWSAIIGSLGFILVRSQFTRTFSHSANSKRQSLEKPL
jgi:hypothetical protein